MHTIYRCIIFDDSFEHEAENTSDLPRVVLIIDIWHPDLSNDDVSFIREIIITLFIQ